MFSKKKIEDQFEKIISTEDITQKVVLLKKQLDYFKSQQPDFEYDYKDFLMFIDEFQISKNYEYNLLWLQLINEIIRLNPSMKKKYFKSAMKIVFYQDNDEEINNNKIEINKEEIYKIKLNTINIFTNKCLDIFECDTYFQNLNRLKSLLKLFIIELLPYFYNRDINILLQMIVNLFLNINKNITTKKYLKSNYFSIIFNLLIEILCFQSLYYSFKVLDLKGKRYKKNTVVVSNYNYYENIIDIDYDLNEKEEHEENGIFNFIDNCSKSTLLELIDKSNVLFQLYLNLNNNTNLNIIVNYQILMKIFIIHCLESMYSEKNSIDFFNLIINNFKMNKILKMISESFDDEIFNLFYISQEENDIIGEEMPMLNNGVKGGMNNIGNNKLKSINIFFYICEYRTKEIEGKNYYNNFLMKFNGLRNKLLQNKEFINNGLFILINLILNDILSKNNKTLNFEEEIIIITLIKCVMKYIIKTNITDMLENNKNNIDNFVNLLIDRFGSSLSEKIWKELMVLIKYYYFELSKQKTVTAIERLKVILKKMLKLKVNGNYRFDENLFYDILNKVYDNKNKLNQVNDNLLYSVYIKNKFKSSVFFNKNIFSCTEFFISDIKQQCQLFEVIESKKKVEEMIKNPSRNSRENLDTLANYLLAYFNTYSKYENKNMELFIYKNFIHLNIYFSRKKNLQSQYIKLVIGNLNNTNDLNYYQCLISYLISLHANQGNFSELSENRDQTLNLYKKIIIKLIQKLSQSNQIQKLDYLFESIYNRLDACLNNEIDYNFLKNILEIFRHMRVTKYEEILVYNKTISTNKIDNINEHYFNIGQNNCSSILVGDSKKYSKKVSEEWCLVDIKELFSILIKLLKKENISIEFKEKIINFIKEKVSDIFFFNKIDIDSFIDYVIDLDKDNLKNFILYMDKTDIMLSINEILQHLAYLMLYHKHLFELKDYKETYDKLIAYVFDKINYFNKIIRIIIKKYEIKAVKMKNWKHYLFMKKILGTNKEGLPNIDNLKLDPSDFKINKKDKEKDINYQLFMDEDIQIDKFVYPKKNFVELVQYLKSYFHILGISLSSLCYNYYKNSIIYNPPFTKQIEERKLNIRFDKETNAYHIQQDKTNILSKYINGHVFSNEIIKKYNDISEKVFNLFSRFPLILKYNPSFLTEFFKFFFYAKDFLISCGEKFILKSILVLFDLSFPEYYNIIFDELNKEFKNKYNDGKNFSFDKIERLSFNNNTNNDSSNNSSENKLKRGLSVRKSNNSTSVLINANNILKSSNELSDSNRKNLNEFHSNSVMDLSENIANKRFVRASSIDETNIKRDESNEISLNDINDSKNENTDNETEKNTYEIIKIIKKLVIWYISKSKNSLKIYNIINNILSQKNNEEDNLFLLNFKWKIINKENIKRNEDINVFKSLRKLKNYFGGGGKMQNISIENFHPNKTVSIKSPISNTNYLINNDYKKIQFKSINKKIMKSLMPEEQCKEVENILSQKHSQENKRIISKKEKYIKSDSNTFCFASTPNLALNEIKEAENEDKDNFSESDNEKNNNEDNNIENEDNNDDSKYIDNDDKNVPNLEELISIMHNKTKNDCYKYYSNNINETNNISHEINGIDKSALYNEIEINVMYIIYNNDKKNPENIQNTNFIKFLQALTAQEEGNHLLKKHEQKEYIYADNFNIINYIINNSAQSNNNYPICLIFNNTLQNNTINNNSIIMNFDFINNNEKIYVFVFIIPISDEFWRIEFKINPKKKDEYMNKLKNILENNFLNYYILSIRNDFSYIVYHLKILFAFLQNFVCIIKKEINDKKILNKLQGIKYEETLNRLNIFKSIN